MKLVTITTYNNAHNAYIAKAILEQLEIEVFLKDELINQLYSFQNSAFGGVSLQVEEVHELKAKLALGIEQDFNKNEHANLLIIKSVSRLKRFKIFTKFSETHILFVIIIMLSFIIVSVLVLFFYLTHYL